jgi:hypothetical protein
LQQQLWYLAKQSFGRTTNYRDLQVTDVPGSTVHSSSSRQAAHHPSLLLLFIVLHSSIQCTQHTGLSLSQLLHPRLLLLLSPGLLLMLQGLFHQLRQHTVLKLGVSHHLHSSA